MAETTRARRPQVEDPAKERDQWIGLLDALVRDVESWVRSEWATRVIQKEMGDSILGEYQAPALLMQRELTRVLLEPITRFAPGVDGVVDLYLMPAYDDIATLFRASGEWRLHHSSRGGRGVAGIRNGESRPLDRDNFLRVLDAIAGHAASAL